MIGDIQCLQNGDMHIQISVRAKTADERGVSLCAREFNIMHQIVIFHSPGGLDSTVCHLLHIVGCIP